MELKQLQRTAHLRVAALTAIIVLCAGWSASALSATTTSVECDDLIRDLRSLESPAEPLSATKVDLASAEPIAADIELLDARTAHSETAAPFLFLTPRVASVLRDIFDISQEIWDLDVNSEPSSSPVAETGDAELIPDISELLDQTDPAGSTENAIDLPLFQQRMFRTDI